MLHCKFQKANVQSALDLIAHARYRIHKAIHHFCISMISEFLHEQSLFVFRKRKQESMTKIFAVFAI